MKRRDSLLTLACILSAVLAWTPASSADELQSAIAAVKSASDNELRKEFERRFSSKGQTRARPGATRGLSARSANPAEAPNKVLAAVSDAQLVMAVHVTSRAIYGVDDRKDWYQISASEGVQPLAQASVALFDGAMADPPSNGTVHLKTTPYKDKVNLCATPKPPKFFEQPLGAFCSGVLVRADVVLTAGHCVREISGKRNVPERVTGTKFVFGYYLQNEKDDPSTVPAANLFTGRDVLGGEWHPDADVNRHDWALVRLDRPVSRSLAVPVTEWDTGVTAGEHVFVIGFPAGMPLKYAPNATVHDASNPAWFVANLDTFGGNSGSGVYDQLSRKLIGILVSGEADYYQDKQRGCYLITQCARIGSQIEGTHINCSGETVSRISQVNVPLP